MAISAASYNQPSVPARFQQARQSLVTLKSTIGQSKTTEEVSFEVKRETRIRFATQPVYASRPTYGMRDVYTERDVTEDRAVYETRPTYADRPVYETKLTGSRDLRGFASATAAGLDEKADFSVQVGSGAAARVQFTGSTVAVTQNGATHNFAYTASAGSFQSAMVAALSSVSGLTASLDTSGHLSLKSDNAESLKLAEVTNELLDLSGTALDKLGLSAGTVNRQQTGTVREQNGTEQVQTGTETVIVGRESVKTGSERYEVGSETYISGSEQVEDGTESVVTGYERVVKTTDASAIERRTKQMSARQAMVSLIKAAQNDIGSAGAVGTRIAEGLAGIIGVLGSSDPLSADKLDTAVSNLDKARAAYMTSAYSGSGGLFAKSV
ncbi:hypothetical protein [Devosia sp. Leaf64]|uniref:hypothetical protein n=1 Tax=Devosia sp. Leaf64 TaxID=1736229 RepID=UPI0007141C2B|nr:hypothetical protein [Devosia sp. Leaf64]KQN77170.1 hypothetical protein ASE94_16785 [Devosia sp. Leaf64]